MQHSSSAPSVVAPCRHCDVDTVWLRTVNGGWHLFDATMKSTSATFDGNRYAIDRRSRLVVDLDSLLESRWPALCLTLHRFRCPASYEQSRFHHRRPRQANDVELTDLWQRLADARRRGHDDLKLGFAG
ncbi:hypothetical protein [Mycolicibacterium komossense]|uniref:Uncharacterized protein n=1 Tax=Mycolicibacterium komossense TaxID=1779 RepID=A0ABT3CEP1_9MYCO|nr:hypothetical protein [Mycolicibacterium komossense]MCV7227957.1 hypothetical protein [Mycolicibacterium komossense]